MKHIKKTGLVVIVLIILSIINIALAEDFEFRNGIHFGDDPQTVKQKESFPSKYINEENRLVFGNGVIATVQDCEANYFFTDSQLTDVLYIMNCNCSDGDQFIEDFRTVYNGLIRKYGDPLATETGKVSVIQGKAFEKAYNYIDMYKGFGGKGNILNQAEWVVPSEEYYIKIDQIVFMTQAVGQRKITYQHMISYRKFTDNDIDNANELLKTLHDKIDNDL